VFITSSTKDVLPVHAVDDRVLSAAHPVTDTLQRVFREAAGRDLDP
jgi:branched-chain amino acid aminotransferase